MEYNLRNCEPAYHTAITYILLYISYNSIKKEIYMKKKEFPLHVKSLKVATLP